MQFEVRVGDEGKPYHFDQYYEMLDFISERLAVWNNFGDHLKFSLEVNKTQNEGDISVNVQDVSNTTDRMA